jgi:hypothetical protein
MSRAGPPVTFDAALSALCPTLEQADRDPDPPPGNA